MAARSSAAVVDTSDRELHLERLFDAPRDLVFAAWTDPKRVASWWGPQGFTTLSLEMEPREGGRYRHTMRSEKGTVHTKRGTFREIVAPELIVFTFAWENAQGGTGPQTVVTVRLFEEGRKTRLTLDQAVFESVSARDLHVGGWTSTLARLAAHISA